MKHATTFLADNEMREARAFERILADGRRLIICCEHTDKRGVMTRFWLCVQERNPCHGSPDYPMARRWTVSGQRYLEKNGSWQEPHGAKHRRNFSRADNAIRFALTVNPCPELSPA